MGNYASVAEKCRACSMQECEDVLRLGYVGAVAEDDWMAVAEVALKITEREVEEIGDRDGTEETVDGEQGEFFSGLARDV